MLIFIAFDRPRSDHGLTIIDHGLIIIDHGLTIIDHGLTIIDHGLTIIDHGQIVGLSELLDVQFMVILINSPLTDHGLIMV